MANAPLPFHAERYELDAWASGAALSTMGEADADRLGPELAAIDPWKRYGFRPDWFGPFLKGQGDGALRFRLSLSGELAGSVVIRPQWLAGPYLATFAVLPPFQRQGLGRAVMAWMESEGRNARARNLWLCVSAFNSAGIGLYAACGFTRVALLDDLV